MNTRHLRPEDLRGKRWRGLIRESTERQAEQWSPDRQRADLARAAEELGLVGDGRLYVRVGSGEDEGVPELEQALADAKRNEFDVLLVIHTSRFARNRAEAVVMKREFRRAGIVIYFVSQRLISGTFAGGLAEGINEVIDEHANEERRFWIAGGLRERQLAGLWVGRIPFGYRKHMADRPDGSRAWDGILEEDPATAPIVREMYAMTARGMSGRDIAQVLNRRGIPNANAGPWAARTVTDMLENPVYVGRHLRYRYTTTRHYYDEADAHDGRRAMGEYLPAIVSEREWQDCRTIIAARSRGRKQGNRQYPLSGVLRCHSCGNHYAGAHNGSNRYYRCHARAQGKVDCDGPSITAAEAEQLFAGWLDEFHLPPDWREAVAASAIVESKRDDAAERAKLARRLEKLKQLYLWGDLDGDTYRAESAALKAEMGKLAKPDNGGLIMAVAAALEALGDAWADDEAPEAARRALPRLMLRSATVDSRERITFNVRAELRPLVELCRVPASGRPYSTAPGYTVRFVG